MNEIKHVLKYKILSFIKINGNLNSAEVLKNIGSFIIYAGFAFGAFVFTKSIISFLLLHVKVGTFLLHRFISVLLFIFFITVNVGNIIVSFSTLYKSDEIYYLFTKPISFTKLFIIKFLDNFFYSSSTLLLIVLAVLTGYGVYFKLGLSFYFISIFLMMLPFMFIAACIGVIMLMLIILLASKIGSRLVIAGLSVIYFISVIVFFQFSNPVKISESVMKFYPNINQYFGFLDTPLSKLLPNFWVADGLYWMSNGNIKNAVPYVMLLLSASAILFLFAIITARKIYFKTWISSHELKFGKTKKPEKKDNMLAFTQSTLLEPQREVLVKKEFWLFFREPSQWIHLAVMIVLIGVFVISLTGIDTTLFAANNLMLNTIIYLVIFLFNSFLISALALRFVFPLISIEGLALWKIKSSPVKLSKLLNVKLFYSFLIIFIIGQILSYFSNLHFPAELSISSSLNILFITITSVALNFGMGSIFSNYKEKNPIRLASSQGASLTFLLTLIYLTLIVAISFLPIYNFFHLKLIYNISYSHSLSLVNLLNGLLSFLIAVVFLYASYRIIQKDF